MAGFPSRLVEWAPASAVAGPQAACAPAAVNGSGAGQLHNGMIAPLAALAVPDERGADAVGREERADDGRGDGVKHWWRGVRGGVK